MKVDWLIVGAGFTGSTLAERIASQLGQTVLLVERRDHVGGNAYDRYDEHGILIHQYGPHIFHTNYQRVWNYLSAFTQWRAFSHRVRAVVDGKEVPVPFNLTSLHMLFSPEQATKLETLLVRTYGAGQTVPVLQLREAPNDDLQALGQYVYEKIFHGYTLKQWAMRPEQLSPSVTGRVPVVIGRNGHYFHDTYQAMPAEGYTVMFQRMLDHQNIQVLLETDYRDIAEKVRADRTIYTGTIDGFCNYKFGPLPYRSMRFELAYKDVEFHQEVGVVNYPNDQEYTRITEFKHLTGQDAPGTTIAVEYSEAHESGRNEPYYPIPCDEVEQLSRRYHAEAEKLRPKVLFAGRLGNYKYYNMDQAVKLAIDLFDSEVAR